jgi:uncharacterized protein
MSILINPINTVRKPLELAGEIPVNDLDINSMDELLQLQEPLRYELTVQRMGDELLVQGWLRGQVHCECVRCLKPFVVPIALEDWACAIALAGEEAAPIKDDCVDLTPFIREDIVLALPQHPLCEAGCTGLKSPVTQPAKLKADQTGQKRSVWSALDKLKLD